MYATFHEHMLQLWPMGNIKGLNRLTGRQWHSWAHGLLTCAHSVLQFPGALATEARSTQFYKSITLLWQSIFLGHCPQVIV